MKFISITLCIVCLIVIASAHGLETSITPHNRIIGGINLVNHNAPYFVTIGLDEHVYGGALIRSRWVLTAGNFHEPPPISEYTVWAGKINRVYHHMLDANKQGRKIALVFKCNSKRNSDITLLKVDIPFIFDMYVKSISLPRQTRYVEKYGQAFGFGFGSINEAGTRFLDKLQTAQFDVISNENCKTVLPIKLIYPEMLCAGSPSHHIVMCNGDSGGPLVIRKRDGHLRLIGIVAWPPIPCQNPYSLFNRVSEFVEWINDTISRHNN